MLSSDMRNSDRQHKIGSLQKSISQSIGRLAVINVGERTGERGHVINAWLDGNEEESVMVQIMTATCGVIDAPIRSVGLLSGGFALSDQVIDDIEIVCGHVGILTNFSNERLCKINGVICINGEVSAVGLLECWTDSMIDGDWETITVSSHYFRSN
ncbi:hypothetical protein [Endozoicomonas sp. ONNA1]|uniref:hypothetical protein n=1 Tax=Endozoicomonas sp. ONNA1 TaxID=2828740 RepID=UPI0021499918|nr:hypothetical protein [Endozoicomonas sp. ONNA1]